MTKYSSKKEAPSKLSSQLQSLIDLKWNNKQNDQDEEIEEEEEEEIFIKRTSSRSMIPPKHDLDEFEKLEQYAEEHPSMISTASYVDQVVFKDHQRKVK